MFATSLDEQKTLLQLDSFDWQEIGEWASRGDSRLIPSRQPDPDDEMLGYRRLAYTALRYSFEELQVLARRDSVETALVHLARLRTNPAMQVWASVLHQDLDELCEGVAVNLVNGGRMVFEPLERAEDENAIRYAIASRKRRVASKAVA